jgi:PAS domain S-box-containing protein
MAGEPPKLSATGAEELYEHAPCGFLSTLPDGTIVRINQTLLDWLGMARDELVGTIRFQSLLTIGGRMYYETHYAPLLQMQGVVREIALEIRRADGTVCPVVASAQRVRDADGRVIEHRIALFDSTDRRRYERELLAARKDAERAARELAEADRAKNVFIAMLAHELRNPLAPIRNAVEILKHSARDSVAARATVIMERQVEQMTRLVDDLLDISRVREGKLVLRVAPADLRVVVDQAVEATAPTLRQAGLAFETSAPPTAVPVDVDAVRISQVLGNVLNNAAKFTPRGGTVALTLEAQPDVAVIRIRDSGVGIDADAIDQVFDLFMQTGGPARVDGLGIGLTLAKSLVERHNGTITVRSAGRDLGTEVTIELPIASTTEDRPVDSVPLTDAAPVARRVLVVDDNRDSAEMMALLLNFLGHETRVVHDGLAAVEAASEFRPHVVLLDLQLPKLDGYGAAERIRQQGRAAPVLVALTGRGADEDRRKSTAAGFSAHLVKPVDHHELTRLIAELTAH